MSTDLDFRKRIESLQMNNPDNELLVLGNSFAEYGIDTELLSSEGIESYNLGLVGSSDQTSFIQLSEYLDRYPVKPECVLHCVASNTDPFYNEGIEPIVEFTMDNNVLDINDIPVSKFRWLWVEFLKKIVSRNHRKTIIQRGQVKSPMITPDVSDINGSELDIQKIISSHWIGEIARLCHQNLIKLIIIEMPGFKETQNLTGIGPRILTFNNGCTAVLYNFNSKDFCRIFDPGRDWGGMSHLNQFGAEKFTKELLSYLKTNNQ